MPSENIQPAVLRRLLAAKILLASNADQLTPDSDPIVVGKMVLVAHDAAELAAAAIADHLEADLSGRHYLTQYPVLIEQQRQGLGTFPGKNFLSQLDKVRTLFKHSGISPDAREWFHVVENTWKWVDSWCSKYLALSIDEIDMAGLLSDQKVKEYYRLAKEHGDKGEYREALECVAYGLYHVLDRFPRIFSPTVGKKDTEQALLLAAFGVRSSDFLTLQELLPNVSKDGDTLSVRWDARGTGNPANWVWENVRYCLETFVDIAVKVQQASRPPLPLEFAWVFDDVIAAVRDGVELFEVQYEGTFPFHNETGRKTVKVMRKGETLRCALLPSEYGTTPSLAAEPIWLKARPTLETAEYFYVRSEEVGGWPLVARRDVAISCLPKEKDWIKSICPHLFA